MRLQNISTADAERLTGEEIARHLAHARAEPLPFDPGDDPCLQLFATLYPAQMDFPLGAHILEIGCSEADWLDTMKFARPDVHLTGIDWRRCPRPYADLVIHGDVLQQDFGAETFDAVVLISALEHIGLGHYANQDRTRDPLSVRGDVETLERVWRWLRPGGWVYFDVPWNPDPGWQVQSTRCRIYDDRALADRLSTRPWRKSPTWYADQTETSHLLPRPHRASIHGFYYAAQVWTKPSYTCDEAGA